MEWANDHCVRSWLTINSLALRTALGFLLFALYDCSPTLPPYSEAAADQKIIEWGWGTPNPVYVRDHVRDMEKLPFDGLVLDLTANGQPSDTGHQFSWKVWDARTLSAEDYSEHILALKATRFERFTDNFLRFNVTPGEIDWYDQEFNSVLANARLAARIAKESRLKGLLVDVEHYGGKPFNYGSQRQKGSHGFAEYQQQVRQRGRAFMQALSAEYPDITILLTYGYHAAYYKLGLFKSLESAEYGLLPPFLDGLLEAASPGMLIFDGWEYAYGYQDETQFKKAYDTMMREDLEHSATKDQFRQHYRTSFGLWIDNKHQWDTQNFSNNYFSPAAFEESLRLALQYTDRYVWIYSENARWWEGKVPQAYIDALKRAREQSLRGQ